MSDTERRLDDIEKRLILVERATALLERAAEKPAVDMVDGYYSWWRSTGPATYEKTGSQFCACGRDICRAPDCQSHKHDPLGR